MSTSDSGQQLHNFQLKIRQIVSEYLRGRTKHMGQPAHGSADTINELSEAHVLFV